MSRFYEAAIQNKDSVRDLNLPPVGVPGAAGRSESQAFTPVSTPDAGPAPENAESEQAAEQGFVTTLVPLDWWPLFRKRAVRDDASCLRFEGDSVPSEQYRILRTHLLQLSSRPQCIVVSSASPEDGKTLTAINLAGIMAMKSDERVLLIDGDLRRKSVARQLGLDDSPGLADVLNGDCAVHEAIVSVEQFPNLHVLTAGAADGTASAKTNPTELLERDTWRSTMEAVRRQFSTAIAHTTPLAVLADFRLVQRWSDGYLLVVRPDHTDKVAFQRALDEQKNKLLGVVINGYRDWFLWSTTKDYGYYAKGGQAGWLARTLRLLKPA